MTVYVLRYDFYQHLLGVYSTEEKAWEAAHRFHEGDRIPFGQLDFTVEPVELDSPAGML